MSDEARLNAEIGFACYLIQAKQLDKARDSLLALKGAASDLAVQAWNELGSAYFGQERYREAEAAFRQAQTLAPSNAEAAMGLGYALFNQNRSQEAVACFAALTEKPESAAMAWRAISAARLNASDIEGARQGLAKALKLNPGDAESHALIGLLAYRQSEADRRWREWTRQNLHDPAARPNLLGGALAAGDLEAALASIWEARRIDSRIRTDELGARLLVVAGRPEAALDFLAACPDPDARTWQWMADVSWLLRDEAQARVYLRRSLEARMAGEPESRSLSEDALALPWVAEGLQAHRSQVAAPTPLVWVHWDAPVYFAHSIAGALAASPATPLLVLGDATNAFAPCQHLPMLRRGASAWEFLERYRHASENDFVYEAFCLMRWFFLKDWAQVAGIKRLATLDSDVLLFADLERELIPRLEGRDLGFTGPMGPHLAVLSERGLADLCAFFMDSYAQGAPGGGGQVTDMTLLPRFLANRDWADFSQEIDGARVDMNIRQSEGFAMAGATKEIHFRRGHAFARREGSAEQVRLLALHFQGTGKQRMAQALKREAITF